MVFAVNKVEIMDVGKVDEKRNFEEDGICTPVKGITFDNDVVILDLEMNN